MKKIVQEKNYQEINTKEIEMDTGDLTTKGTEIYMKCLCKFFLLEIFIISDFVAAFFNVF